MKDINEFIEYLKVRIEEEYETYIYRPQIIMLLEYINNIEKENEKLNHYKLLYQKVKNRNNEAIEYIEGHMMNPELMDEFEYISTSPKKLLEILKCNIEEVSND